jgi:serine/threonine protein kinase
MPQDRAQRPDTSSGSFGAASQDGGVPSGGGVPSSLPDVSGGGTYFLGRYRIVDEIGIGGMASVHLARMDGPGGFQKWVAIKKIHPHLVEDDSFVQMFLDEARVAARISHPNVATVFDLGKHDETYWIAMEYLHGEPLREVMRRTEELGTAMPPEIACRVIADAAEGLHAAHELLGKNGEKLGLVHRDVTPHNLFVTYDGVTKVVDFGIAKFSSRMSHTRAGTLKGKLAYMSPEQVHGEGIDRRTDIFALGVVLWELTTGQRLFRMESDLDTLAKVQECNVPRPSTLIRGYPVDLEKIVMKALAKNRGERFRTARELSRALQSLLMRRGLFIASDEVAAYTQSIFSDRIQKREAHLRWAAEVTQTINIDQMLSKPKIGPEYTSSEMQPSSNGPRTGTAPPRPAAGMVVPSSMQQPPPLLPDDFKDMNASFTTPRSNSGPPKPTSRAAPPRPAAGVPVTPPSMPPEEPHPADGDGPTIQAAPSMMEEVYSARAASLNEPPNLSEPPTLMGAMAGSGRPNGIDTIEPEDYEEEDGAETIVANTANAPSFQAVNAKPMFPQPTGRQPTAPMPMGGMQQPPPQPFGSPNFSSMNSGPSFGAPAFTGEVPFDSMARSGQSMGMQGFDYGPQPGMPNDGFGFNPAGPSDMIPRGAHPSTSNRMIPNGRDNRTMTAQRFKRRPPMWVVAALSCSIALLIAGVVIAIISTTSPAPQRPPQQNGATNAVGPFTATRTAFNLVVTGTPSGGVAAVPPTAAPPPHVDPPPVVAAAPAAPPTTVTAPPTPAPPTPQPPSTPTAAARPTPAPVPVPVPQPTPATTPKKNSAALGALTVVCMPKCDQIIDNGTPLGPGHIFNRPVPSGRHSLVLSAPNGVKKTLQVDVSPEQTREVRISMDKN